MKKYLFIIIGLCVMTICFQRNAIQRIKSERDRYEQNTNTLLTNVKYYKTESGKNAARAGQLELTLKECQKLLDKDYETIKELQEKHSDVAGYIGTGTSTEVQINVPVIDTMILRDTILVPMKCIHYKDNWTSLDGCFFEQEFVGNIQVRDSLVIVETVKRKRFLGFLWKTKKTKSRSLDVTSKNPHTKIDDVIYVKIKD